MKLQRRNINQLKAGTTLSYVNVLLSAVVTLLFPPFMISSLGGEEFGLYATIGSVASYLALFDFGLGNAIIRYVAKYRAEHDEKGEANFLAISMILYGVISVLATIVGIVLTLNLGSLFPDYSDEHLAKAQIMVALLIVNVVGGLFLNAFSGIMTGAGEFVFPRLRIIARTLLRPAVLVVVLLQGFDSVAIVIVDTILCLVFMLINIRYCFRGMGVKIKLYNFNFKFVREIFSFSFFLFLNLVVDMLYWKAGQIMLGAKDLFAAGAYENVMMIKTMYLMISGAISGVFLPRVTQMEVRKASGEEFTDLMIRTGRMQFIVIGLILAGFTAVGKPFIRLWIGSVYDVVYPISVLMMVALFVPLIQSVGISVLQAKKMHWFRGVSYLGIAILCIASSILTIDSFGIWGVAVSTMAALFLGQGIVMNFYYHFKVGLNIPRMFAGMCKGLLPSMLLAFAAGWGLSFIPPLRDSNLLGFLVPGFTVVAVYAVCMLTFGFNAEEKELFRSITGKITGIFRRKKKV